MKFKKLDLIGFKSFVDKSTIIINEKKLEGSASFKNIEKKIEKLI